MGKKGNKSKQPQDLDDDALLDAAILVTDDHRYETLAPRILAPRVS